MPLFQLFVLAIVQGITEFLPISSSGHLILTRTWAGWHDPGTNLDIAVHVGTLLAVMVYFRADTWRLCRGLADGIRLRRSAEANLFWLLALATLPVLVVGLVLAQLDLIDVLRQPKVIAWATIGFAVPLWLADRYGTRARPQEQLRWRDFLLLGLAQACAAIPGASRAGVTVTAGRWLGLDRKAAAHISMLMAIPTIIAAGSYSALELYLSGDLALGLDALFAAVMSFFTALLAIWALMAWVDRIGYGPFVLYRLVLGGALLYWLS